MNCKDYRASSYFFLLIRYLGDSGTKMIDIQHKALVAQKKVWKGIQYLETSKKYKAIMIVMQALSTYKIEPIKVYYLEGVNSIMYK